MRSNGYQHINMASAVVCVLVAHYIFRLTGKDIVYSCLTWNVDENSIRFVCTIDGSRTVSLIDNHGNYVARCSINGSSENCVATDFVKPIVQNNFVTFDIDRNRQTDVNGKWSCIQQDNKFITEVLISKDFTDSTIVNLFGRVVEDDKVQRLLLTCSSCRIPKGKNAEFLMNNSSVDSITFNDETGKCTHLDGECIADECNCSSSGNTFSRFFLLKRPLQIPLYFSCDMRFEDKAKSVVFSKVPRVSFNGKEFKNRGTRTVITKFTDDHNNTKDKDGDTVEVWIAVISAITVVAIILIAGVYSHMKRRNREKKKNTDEVTPFIETKLKKEEINYADPTVIEIKDKIIQVNLQEPIRSHGNRLQCKLYGKKSCSKTDQSVTMALPDSEEETGDEDSVASFNDLPHFNINVGSISSDIKGGSIKSNEITIDSIQVEVRYPGNESKCKLCGMELYTKAETNDKIVQVNLQEDIIWPCKSSKEVKRNQESDVTTESHEESEEENYIQARDKLKSQSIPHTTDRASQTNTDRHITISCTDTEGKTDDDDAFFSSDEDSYSYVSSGSVWDNVVDSILAKLDGDHQHQLNRPAYVAAQN